MNDSYDINETFPYSGKSLSVKVLDNKRVNLTGKVKGTLKSRRGRVFKILPFWTYIPKEEDNKDLVCQLVESIPKEDAHAEYELTTINNSGGFRLHPDSEVKEGEYVSFVGEGNHIDIVKAEKREEGKRSR